MPAIVEYPQVVREAVEEFRDLFSCEPQRRHFAEYLTGLMIAATLDRLTHRCHILEATGESYRLQDARRRRGVGRKREERRAPQGEDLL